MTEMTTNGRLNLETIQALKLEIKDRVGDLRAFRRQRTALEDEGTLMVGGLNEKDERIAELEARATLAEARLWYVLHALWGDREIEIQPLPDCEAAIVVDDLDGRGPREYRCADDDSADVAVLRVLDAARADGGKTSV